MKPKLFMAMKAFIVHDGKVLIVRESPKNPVGTNPNKYDVVGGRLEPGERFDECLVREIKEHGEPWQIVGVFFECVAKTNTVQLSVDHDDFKWIDPKDYKKYPLIENLYPAFEVFLAR